MRIHIVVPMICALLGCSGVCSSTAAHADDMGVTLKYVNKVGDLQHQQMLIKATVQGIDAVVKASRRSQVKEVKDNGDFTVLEIDEGGTLTLMGNDQKQDPGPDITIKRDKNGKLLDWKPAMDVNGVMAPEVMRATEMLYSVIFPSTPVKANDTWKIELDNPVYDKMKIKIENTYVGTEKVDGVELWKIKQKSTVPTDGEGGIATFEGTFWLNPANGQTAKMDGSVKDVPSQFGKLSFTLTVSPIKDDKPTAAASSGDTKAPK